MKSCFALALGASEAWVSRNADGLGAVPAGALLARTRTHDVVDASVAELSIRKQADVASDDADDIRRLLAAANAKTSILDL
jgi:hypothetical protein